MVREVPIAPFHSFEVQTQLKYCMNIWIAKKKQDWNTMINVLYSTFAEEEKEEVGHARSRKNN